jgi:hypothetical protein
LVNRRGFITTIAALFAARSSPTPSPAAPVVGERLFHFTPKLVRRVRPTPIYGFDSSAFPMPKEDTHTVDTYIDTYVDTYIDTHAPINRDDT